MLDPFVGSEFCPKINAAGNLLHKKKKNLIKQKQKTAIMETYVSFTFFHIWFVTTATK